MPNPFFRFKQFTVYHDRCAMKVGTDGVLLGAWINIDNAKKILDIGSGSGLISLMIAQRSIDADIYAIDIDVDAIDQTCFNVASSPFANRILSECISLNDYAQNTDYRFDLIVSNPPFFIDSLKSPDNKRSLARHTDTLLVEDLIRDACTLLTEKGRISLIYPTEYKDILVELAKTYNLFITRITDVYPTLTSKSKRILIELSKESRDIEIDSLVIEVERHIYSDLFVDMLRDFYLKF